MTKQLDSPIVPNVVVWSLLLTLLVAGCSPEPTGPAPADAPDRAGAPLIQQPRSLTSRASSPCDTLLSPTRVRRLGYDLPGEASVDVLGAPTCTWREDGTARESSVSVVLTRDLFVDTYRNRFLPIFRPVLVADLPAVDVMSGPQVLVCTTTVGVADGESLELNTSVGRTDGVRDGDPCEEGHRVAEEIVSTLPRR